MRIITVPNGYVLDIQKNGYVCGFFYFSLEKLLEGFIYRIGFKELGSVKVDKIGTILEAAAAWKDNATLVRRILALENDNQALQLSISALEQEIKAKKECVKDLRETLAEKNKRIKELEGVLKEHPNWLRK